MGMAERLKQLRRAAGLSEQDLAQAAGLSLDLLSQLEAGRETDPRLSTVRALARALGVPLDRLIEGPDEAAPGGAIPSAAPPPAEELQAQAASPPPQPREAELPPPQTKPHARKTRRPRGS